MPLEVFRKHPDEDVPIPVPFHAVLGSAALNGASAAKISGTGGNTLAIGTVLFDSSTVFVPVSGGADGEEYVLEATAQTSERTLVYRFKVLVEVPS